MDRKIARVSLLCFASLLFLGVTLSSSPLVPAARDLDSSSLELSRLFDRQSTEAPAAHQFNLFGGGSPYAQSSAAGTFELFGRADAEAVAARLPLAMPFRNAIERTADRYELDRRLLAAVVEAESNFNPRVVSPRGAVGLTQVLPATGGLPGDELHDPDTNLDAGARYLRSLLDQYDGDVSLALAAYNAGPSRVARYGGMPPFGETRHYVRKVLGLYELHQQGDWQSARDEARGR